MRLCLLAMLVVGAAQMAAAPAPLRPRARVEMAVTAYCTEGETASGAETRRGIVAADPRVLPLGSRVRVKGLGRPHDRTYDVEDTGREVKGRELDIFIRDCAAAKAFGRQQAQVQVLRVGDGSRVSERAAK